VKLSAEQIFRRLGNTVDLVGMALSAGHKNVSFVASVILSIRHEFVNELQDDWSETISDMILDALRIAYARRVIPGEEISLTKNKSRREAAVPRLTQARPVTLRRVGCLMEST
jgi:hypothetical protein